MRSLTMECSNPSEQLPVRERDVERVHRGWTLRLPGMTEVGGSWRVVVAIVVVVHLVLISVFQDKKKGVDTEAASYY